jgi:RNA polymerase sigma-70 factor (ECF subfamily)
MLQSTMTSRDDGAPGTGGKLRLVTTGLGQARKDRQEVPGLADDKGLGDGHNMDEGAIPRILDRARAGDPEAFRAIFQRFGRPILAFIFHFLGDRSRSEELTQETFLRAHRGLAKMPEGIKLSTWLFGIARNVAREAIRDQRRRRREVGLDDIAFLTVHDEKAGPDENFMSEELQRMIRRALGDLSEDQRVVFVLKLFSKMRYEEISLITGSSIGKLKTDLHRARQQMRERLQSYITGRVPGN